MIVFFFFSLAQDSKNVNIENLILTSSFDKLKS